MTQKPNSKRTLRHALIISGTTDAMLGAAVVLAGLGFFPIDIARYGFPLWAVMLAGGVIFTSGVWMVIHNYSRLDE